MWDNHQIRNTIDANDDQSSAWLDTLGGDVGTLPECPWILVTIHVPLATLLPTVSNSASFGDLASEFMARACFAHVAGELNSTWEFRSSRGGLD